MSFGSTISQGSFVSTGGAQILPIRSDVDWIRVINMTDPAVYEWYRGMPNGYAMKHMADGALELITSNGFTLVNSGDESTGFVGTITGAISADATPVVTLASTAGLYENDIIRMGTVIGAHQLGGIDFTIDTINEDVSFDLAFMSQIVAANTGTFRKIKYDALYYPRTRTISSISKAATAVIVLTVTHGYTVGQKVRILTSSANKMTEIDGMIGEILAIDTAANSITVDIDSTAFTTFVFGTTADADAAYTHAQVVPIGDAATTLAGATENKGILGISLAPGDGTIGVAVGGPAGVVNDIIYWIAGTSDSI